MLVIFIEEISLWLIIQAELCLFGKNKTAENITDFFNEIRNILTSFFSEMQQKQSLSMNPPKKN